MSASSKKKLRKEQEAAVLTEKQQQAQKDAKKLKVQTGIFITIVAVILAAAVIGLSITAFSNSGIVERMTTALTIGDHTLTAAELNYFYMDTIASQYETWYNKYGGDTNMYLMYLHGLNVNAPLDEQFYDQDKTITYAEHFTERAVETAVIDYSIYDMAVAEGKKLSEDDIASIDTNMQDLAKTAKQNGYPSLSNYLKTFYGHGANEKTYRSYLEVVTLANKQKLAIYDGLTYTSEDISKYDAEHHNELNSYSYISYYMMAEDFVDCTASEDDKEHKHSEEELNAARRAVEAAANSLRDAKPVDADAVDAAIQNIPVYTGNELATASRVNNLLYDQISNESYAKWLVAAERKPGDITIIPNFVENKDADGNVTNTITGYSFLMFVDCNENNMKMVDVRHILKSFTGGITDEKGNTVYTDAEKAAAKESAEMLLNSWLLGGATSELFADMATANSTDYASTPTGGLYTNVYPGRMVPNFNDWCFAEDRKAGDYGIVETEYGYHVMYLEGHSEQTYRNYMITNALRDNEYNAWYDAIVENAQYDILDVTKVDMDAIIGTLFS